MVCVIIQLQGKYHRKLTGVQFKTSMAYVIVVSDVLVLMFTGWLRDHLQKYTLVNGHLSPEVNVLASIII